VNSTGGELTSKTNFTAPLYTHSNNVRMTLTRPEVHKVSDNGELYLRLRTDKPTPIRVNNMSIKATDDTFKYVGYDMNISNTVAKGGLKQGSGQLQLSAAVSNEGRGAGKKRYTLYEKKPDDETFHGVDTQKVTVNPNSMDRIKFYRYVNGDGKYKFRIGPKGQSKPTTVNISSS